MNTCRQFVLEYLSLCFMILVSMLEVKNVSAYQSQWPTSCLLFIKFHHISFCGCIWEVENASVNQRPGTVIFADGSTRKPKRGKIRWVLASYQLSFVKFHLAVSDEKSKQLMNLHKNSNLVENFEHLLPVKFRYNTLSRAEKWNCISQLLALVWTDWSCR